MSSFNNSSFFMKAIRIICLSSLLISSACNRPSEFEAERIFQSPFGQINVGFEITEINANESQMVHFENGSSVFVPEDAFVDVDGNKVSGKSVLLTDNLMMPLILLQVVSL